MPSSFVNFLSGRGFFEKEIFGSIKKMLVKICQKLLKRAFYALNQGVLSECLICLNGATRFQYGLLVEYLMHFHYKCTRDYIVINRLFLHF